MDVRYQRKSIHGFPSVPLYGYGAPLGGLRSPELRYYIKEQIEKPSDNPEEVDLE